MAACPDVAAPLAAAPDHVRSAVLELNQLNVTELSALDGDRLDQLVAAAFHASAAADGNAFLLAFDQDADYDSPNFHWFRARYSHFVYVDRVAVAASRRGRGLASVLYRGLFDAALEAGHSLIACEVNLDPPNPASDAFHAGQGFEEVGRQRLENGKMVRYLVKSLAGS